MSLLRSVGAAAGRSERTDALVLMGRIQNFKDVFHRTSKMKPATTDLAAKFLLTCVVDCWVSEERAALESVPVAVAGHGVWCGASKKTSIL